MKEMTKTCPYCGEEIPVAAKKCEICGEMLPEEDSAPQSKTIQCPVCGEEIPADVEVCPYCHEKVGEQSEPEPVQTESSAVAPKPKPIQTEIPAPQPAPATPRVERVVTETKVGQEPETERVSGFFKYYFYDVFIRHYADFKGAISRKQYWMGTLLYGIIMFILYVVFGATLDCKQEVLSNILIAVILLLQLGSIVPLLARDIRRLHDVGKKGTFWLINLIPIVGPIIVFVKLVSRGKEKCKHATHNTLDYILWGILGLAFLLPCILLQGGDNNSEFYGTWKRIEVDDWGNEYGEVVSNVYYTFTSEERFSETRIINTADDEELVRIVIFGEWGVTETTIRESSKNPELSLIGKTIWIRYDLSTLKLTPGDYDNELRPIYKEMYTEHNKTLQECEEEDKVYGWKNVKVVDDDIVEELTNEVIATRTPHPSTIVKSKIETDAQEGNATEAVKRRINAICESITNNEDTDKYLSSNLRSVIEKAVNAADGRMLFNGDIWIDAIFWNTVTAKVLGVSDETSNKMTVRVKFTDSDSGEGPVKYLHFVYENNDWFVDDIVNISNFSLKQYCLDCIESYGN